MEVKNWLEDPEMVELLDITVPVLVENYVRKFGKKKTRLFHEYCKSDTPVYKIERVMRAYDRMVVENLIPRCTDIKPKTTSDTLNLDIIWNIVLQKHKDNLKKRKIILEYGKVRNACAKELNITRPEFADWFQKLCDSEYGRQIELHGTIVGDYKNHVCFKYKKRGKIVLYPFFSIKHQAS